MKQQNKNFWGDCGNCGTKINDNNFGYDLEEDRGYICDDCFKKHLRVLIKDLKKFIGSKDFNDKLKLKKKILWVSDQMGHWHDNADKSSMESVTDYDSWSVRKLKLEIVCELKSLIQEAGLSCSEINKLHEKIVKEHEGE